jgi:hypothetical protein
MHTEDSAPGLVEREPALVAGGAASVSQAALIAAFITVLSSFGVIDAKQASALEIILTVLVSAAMITAPWAAARFTRHRVMPVATIERTGLTPDHVNAVADDPARSFKEAVPVGAPYVFPGRIESGSPTVTDEARRRERP